MVFLSKFKVDLPIPAAPSCTQRFFRTRLANLEKGDHSFVVPLSVLGDVSRTYCSLTKTPMLTLTRFHTMLDARQSQGKPVPRIYCFFEELPYNSIVGLIVPRHSAILTRYNNQGIHANHVEMTTFGSSEDQGYRNIRDQIRIWALEIESVVNAGYLQQHSGQGRNLGPSVGISHIYSGSVNSNGGQVIQGNLTSSGDLNLNYNNNRELIRSTK